MGAECGLARGLLAHAREDLVEDAAGWLRRAVVMGGRCLQTLAFFSSSTFSSCFCFLLAARLAAASGVPFLGAAFLGAAFLGAGADLALFAAGASAEAADDRFLGGIGEEKGVACN